MSRNVAEVQPRSVQLENMMRRTVLRSRRLVGGLAAAALVMAACGGGDDTPAATPDEPAAEPADPPADEPDDSADDMSDDATDDTTGGGAATYEPGEVLYRLVNLIDEPVDIYVRTQGLVQAFEIELGVQPGAVTDFVAPPERGTFLVTTAGAGDPECVATCPHVLVNLTAFADDGPHHTVVLHDADGIVQAFDLWEDPEANTTNANAMVSADPANGLFVAVAIDVVANDFGMRLGYDGVAGCIDPANLTNVLVGGNQTPAFVYDSSSVDVLFFDNRDGDCAEEPVGGPFTVTGGPGTRTLMILTGERPGSLEAVILPFANDPEPGTATGGTNDGAGSGASGDGDRDVAIAAMSDVLQAELLLSPDDAACLSPILIDAIGLDEAFQGGELIDLETADEELQDRAFAAILGGIGTCGIDPNALP